MLNIFSFDNIKKLLNKKYEGKEIEIVLFNGINQYIDINDFYINLNDSNNSLSLQFVDNNRDESAVFYIMDKDTMYCQYEAFTNNAYIYLTNRQIINIHELI